jgi:DNA invertase Pin-like site-specific DNA recombinase
MIRHKFDPSQSYTFVRYGRMSSDAQNPRSPDQQFQIIDVTIAKLGHSWVNLRDYRDDGITGKFLKRRPGFSAMLVDIRSSAVQPDLILLDTSERLGRAEELAEIRRQLRVRHGVLILTADSRFADPTTPAGHVMEAFENLRATEENRIKGHQVRRGKVDAIILNHWPGGPVPFGYKLKSILMERSGRQEVDYCLLVPNPKTSWIIVKLFNRAVETGDGQGKLAEFLNADDEVCRTRRKFISSTVGKWLGNPIYIGTLVWGKNDADIVEDVRILQPSAEEDIVVKPGFCEPLIEEKTWAAAQKVRIVRRERCRLAKEKARTNKDQFGKKLIKPLVPGVALVYPLSGLVVCAACGRAMTVSAGGVFKTKSGEERRYPAYFCPGRLGGVCPNKRRIQEPWLFEEVVGRINLRLLPIGSASRERMDAKALEEGTWFLELLGFVQKELDGRRLAESRNHPNLERELRHVHNRVMGLRESLANFELAANVRRCLETDLGGLLNREAELQKTVSDDFKPPGSAQELVDPKQVVERLNRLAEVLRSGNPSEVNVELSHFVDRIECAGDGMVTLRTCRLGFAPSAFASVRTPQFSDQTVQPHDGPGWSDVTTRGTPRRRSIRCVEDRDAAHFVADPNRFEGLPDAWFWTETFRQPKRNAWAEDHADEVYSARLTVEGKVRATFPELEKQFGRSKPTLRNAISIAAKRRRDGRDCNDAP